MVDAVEVAKRIKEARKQSGLTLQEVADVVGVKNSTISRYENGQIKKAKLPVLQAIASALHVNPMWLIGYTDDPVDYEDEDLISSIPLSYMELCEGDVERAYALMKAVDEDALPETKKSPDTVIDVEGLSAAKRSLIMRILALPDDQVQGLEVIVDQVLALRGI